MSKYREKAAALAAQMNLEEKVGQTLYTAPAVERLAFHPITGGMKRCTELREREQRRYFRRRSAWRRHLMRSC